MKEMKKNGPIVVALNAPSDLFYYSGGIYTYKDTEKANLTLTASRWEKTNHAVLAVGWGENEDGKKYWIIKIVGVPLGVRTVTSNWPRGTMSCF